MPDISPAGVGKTLVKKVEYARHRGVNPSLVTRWIKTGRLVMEGKRVVLEASDAKLAGSLDQTRGGRGGSPLAAKKARSNTPREAVRGAPAGETGSPAPVSASSTLVEHRTRREDFAARDAELRFLERAGSLVSRADFERAVREGMGPIANAVDSLAPRIARAVAGLEDVRQIEAAIEAEVRAIRADLRKTLERLLSEPAEVRQ